MKSYNTIKLADLISVASRLGRSINLERDFFGHAPLDGFVLTTTGRSILDRLVDSMREANTSRAWTLTGPFGSGKSAFALFLAKLLCFQPDSDVLKARELLKDVDRSLWRKLFDKKSKRSLNDRGFIPILVSGSGESLGKALLRGLKTAVKNFGEIGGALTEHEIDDLLKDSENLTSREIVEFFVGLSKRVAASNKADGLLVVVDELGKLLDYAAFQRDGDIFILQELAEATKSGSHHSIILITILHQAFDNYVGRLGQSRQEEWLKIHGRFEDVSFLEPTDQILRLISQAIKSEENLFQAIESKIYQRASEIGLVDLARGESTSEIWAGCLPLHPTVSLIIGHLFRRFAQNERSLFAFLASAEPFGFQSFLSETDWNEKSPPLYRLDRLYDYLVTSLGGSLYNQANGRKWLEIESVLDRMNDATPLEIKLVKAIGLLQAVGEFGNLKSSTKLLTFAFNSEKRRDVEDALESLRSRSLVVYRRYNSAFALWEGSDIDIDERVRVARSQVDPNESLAHVLDKFFKPMPIVAKRHSFQTGTLRFFDVRYVVFAGLEAQIDEPLGDSDGRLLFAIGLNDEEVSKIIEKVRRLKNNDFDRVLVAVPAHISNLREALFEVACLKWVQVNTPDLARDNIAQRELQTRLVVVETLILDWLESLYGASKQGYKAAECLWFYQGKRINVNSPRALQEWLSVVCDRVFYQTPILHNELINRRELSSSASSARRELVSAMLSNAEVPKLGIEGYPPHLSMYLSILQKTGMHRCEKRKWGFFPPAESADSGIIAVWSAIDHFLSETEVERKSVADFFQMLSLPPFGLKSGILPVFLFAAILYYDTELALYEQGSFVPSVSLPIFERLVKTPGNFQLQRCRIAGVRSLVFERFAKILHLKGKSRTDSSVSLLEIVRSLTKFAASLPEYTRNTQDLTLNALRVRKALFETREPDRLLFEHLPKACGFEPFVNEVSLPSSGVDRFFKALRESLAELQRKYDELLGSLERMLIAAFAMRESGAEARKEIEERAFRLLELTVDPKLKSFLVRLVNQDLELSNWIESIAAFLVNKPPDAWIDTDLAKFEIGLAQLMRSFHSIDALAFEMNKYERNGVGNDILRLGVTSISEPERLRVLAITPSETPLIEEAKEAINRAFQSVHINGNVELRLAVLAKLSQELLSELDEISEFELKERFATNRIL